MTGNTLYIQSGGPTSVINCSALGVISQFEKMNKNNYKLYASRNSFSGVLNDNIVDIMKEDKDEIKFLYNTPCSIFGSSRHKMLENEYDIFIDNLKKYDIRNLLINGGNGTSMACKEIEKRLINYGYECSIIGIPKTVDNDIYSIDHTPGYPSAARHIILSILDLSYELNVYDSGLIMIIEVMGRKCGWLAAACLLANKLCGYPDLIYTPENVFDFDKFTNDIKNIYDKNNKCMIVVSEGVKTEDGKYLFENNSDLNMGGILNTIHSKIKNHFSCKIRTIDLGLMQRNSSRDTSDIDKKEAFELGEEALKIAFNGETGKFVAFDRITSKPYNTKMVYHNFDVLIQETNYLPSKYIINNGTFIDDSFIDYIEPLVGDFPRYSKFKYLK